MWVWSRKWRRSYDVSHVSDGYHMMQVTQVYVRERTQHEECESDHMMWLTQYEIHHMMQVTQHWFVTEVIWCTSRELERVWTDRVTGLSLHVYTRFTKRKEPTRRGMLLGCVKESTRVCCVTEGREEDLGAPRLDKKKIKCYMGRGGGGGVIPTFLWG